MKIQFHLISALVFSFCLISCTKPAAPVPVDENAPETAPESSPPPATATDTRTDVLIYGGPGSWRDEVASLKDILYSHGATYEERKPDQINTMTVEDFTQFRVLLIAGGNALTVSSALSTETHSRIREAVQKKGLGYLGFCAGAWLAVAPAPLPNEDVIYGLGVVEGPVLQQNHMYNAGYTFGLDEATFPSGKQWKLLWYGGPVTPDTPGGVIAKYSDGTPAISQIWSGKGFVIISGLHPAANKRILNKIGIFEREAMASDLAWSMIDATIRKTPLQAF